MVRNKKVNILDGNAKHGIVSEIDTKEYVTVHIAQLKSLAEDDSALKWGAEIFDKLGAAVIGAILGIMITIDKVSNIAPSWIVTGILGMAALGWGIYLKIRRNAKIDSFVQSVIEDKQVKQPRCD